MANYCECVNHFSSLKENQEETMVCVERSQGYSLEKETKLLTYILCLYTLFKFKDHVFCQSTIIWKRCCICSIMHARSSYTQNGPTPISHYHAFEENLNNVDIRAPSFSSAEKVSQTKNQQVVSKKYIVQSDELHFHSEFPSFLVQDYAEIVNFCVDLLFHAALNRSHQLPGIRAPGYFWREFCQLSNHVKIILIG